MGACGSDMLDRTKKKMREVEFLHTGQEDRGLYVVDNVMRMMKGLYSG